MVHADSSTFASNVTKDEAYAQILEQTALLCQDQRNWVCNLANASSLLWHGLHSLPTPSNKVNWAGFYVVDATASKPTLILGPFHGKVACQTIAFGRGVCGVAAALQRTQLVPNVDEFPGHIACDGDSKSEIVVPIISDGKTVAIIDLDCSVPGGFDERDQTHLESLGRLLSSVCDWP